MGSLQEHARALQTAISLGDGRKAALLLRVDNDKLVGAVQQVVSFGGDVRDAARVLRDEQWQGIATALYECLAQVAQGKPDAYKSYEKVVKPALRAAQKEDLSRKPFWTSVARALAANVRLLAARCHLDVSQSEALTPLLNSTFGNLRSIFSSGAEFAPMLAVHCEIIRVAFIFNRINLGFDQLTLFHDQHLTNAPMADRVTFSYYKARLCILENRFDEARELLQYALDNCPPGARRNRELILKYLVPINMLQGRMPAAQIMRGPAMQPYLQVATAVRAGNVGALQAALDSNLQTFVRDGTVFLLERLKLLAHRRLLQRVCQIYGGMLGPDADDRVKARLPLKYYVAALEASGEETDLDDAECVLANAIYHGKVRAVISHASRILALSKENPFPTLTPR